MNKIKKELGKIVVALYVVLAFILIINENYEAIYLNFIGIAMMVIPLYMSRGWESDKNNKNTWRSRPVQAERCY